MFEFLKILIRTGNFFSLALNTEMLYTDHQSLITHFKVWGTHLHLMGSLTCSVFWCCILIQAAEGISAFNVALLILKPIFLTHFTFIVVSNIEYTVCPPSLTHSNSLSLTRSNSFRGEFWGVGMGGIASICVWYLFTLSTCIYHD